MFSPYLCRSNISISYPYLSDLPIDGYIGVFIAIAIIYSGFNLVKETISPLIGEAPDEELINSIKKRVYFHMNI